MPFGDELFVGSSARFTAQGYLSAGTVEGLSILFTGQYRDTELASSALQSGLDYFMARHMLPGLGRFLQPDPGNLGASAGFPQTWHGYEYVANNPPVNTDPYGLFCPATGCYPDPCVVDPESPLCTGQFPFPPPLPPQQPPMPPPPPVLAKNPQPPTQTSGRCVGGPKGLGFGGLAGASAGIGAGPNGAWGVSGVVSSGGGTFLAFQNGLTKTEGTFSSAGLATTSTGGLGNYPSNSGGMRNQTWGGFAGAGAGFFITNAGNSVTLFGPFTSYLLSIGPFGFEFDWGAGNVAMLSMTMGKSTGVGGAILRTKTFAAECR
jgi:RHS repeat-associated protein